VTITLLVPPEALGGGELVVEGEIYHHVFRAARAASGDAVRAVDGAGRARHGVVTRVERTRAVVTLGAGAPANEPRLHLELLVAAPRPSRASWLVEKGTELGVRAFRFLDCERAARPLDRAALDRLRRVARAALEQSRRSWLPSVTGPHRLDDALAGAGAATVYLLDATAESGPRLLPPGSAEPALLIVGPEGGLTPDELALASRRGARPMRLTPSMLRVETAALAAAAWLLLQVER
jgi:16S rRNA (uracil1498-N3)-methyltransferase